MLETIYDKLINSLEIPYLKGSISFELDYIKWSYDAGYDIYNNEINEHLDIIMSEDFEIINEVVEDEIHNLTISKPDIDESIISIYISE